MGKGTVVTVYLPLIAAALLQEETLSATEIYRGAGCILLVEDEESLLTLGRKILTRMGYQVLSAKEGQAAIELYEKYGDAIDLVILDMTMPIMNGMDCFRELKAMDHKVNVLLSTGHPLQESRELLSAEGISGFLQKPYTLQELAEAVSNVLEKN